MKLREQTRMGLILGLCAALAVGGYLLASAAVFRVGFPLDDAWIHQTYARNLGLRGEWSFLPGVVSAGSTSPLWTGLLGIGYLLGMGPYVWTYVCGFFSLWALAWAGEMIFRKQSNWTGQFPWMGAFLALEWHLVWAASSGMETILFSALILFVYYLFSFDPPRWLAAGFVVSVAVWVRPDGITLLGPLGMMALLGGKGSSISLEKREERSITVLVSRRSLSNLLRAGLGFVIGFVPYGLFNLAISGHIWPNTLFAKQAEYAAHLQLPLLERVGSLLALPLVGAGVLLLPGVVYAFWRGMRERNWFFLALFLWWLGYNFVYSISLPLTYQHGRYLIPSMPVYFLLGGIGMAWLWRTWLAKRAWRRLLRMGWVSGMGLLLAAFLGIGAMTYAKDVAIIETEMVATAHWLEENIPPGARIAVHDIGAVGYFSGANILDTAGLISPEVIPIIRDEDRLAAFLDQEGVMYLVTFPSWYPELVKRASLIYQTSGEFSPAAGGENMAVYRWNNP
jgi:hypothetical protein